MKTSKTEYKTLSLNNEHWEYRKKAYDLLVSQEGIEARLNRSIQAVGSFAQLKANMENADLIALERRESLLNGFYLRLL